MKKYSFFDLFIFCAVLFKTQIKPFFTLQMPLKSPAGQEENMQWMQMSDSIVDNVSPLYPSNTIDKSFHKI